jgi:hypothetical protein
MPGQASKIVSAWFMGTAYVKNMDFTCLVKNSVGLVELGSVTTRHKALI